MSTWKRMTSTYYATAGAMGLKSDVVDAAAAEGARASYDANTVVITYPDGRQTFHKTAVGMRGKAVKFVNDFNERSTPPA